MAEIAEQYPRRPAGDIEGEDPIAIQRQTAAKLSALVAELSPHELTFHLPAGKWSIIEILAHLAEIEMVTGCRYRQMLEQDGVALCGFDRELWARLGTYGAWDRHDAVELFRLLRKANLRMLGSLSPEQWEHSGEHAERGKLTVADIARHMAAHDINHLQQIERSLPGSRQTDAPVRGGSETSPGAAKATPESGMCLTSNEAAEVLRRTPAVLRELILALPERAVNYHPGPGKWCIKEVVGHLAEEDKRDFVGRIEMMLRQTEPRLKLNDQDQVAQQRQDCNRNIAELLDEFGAVRNASVRFVEQLSAQDLERTGVHPRIGIISVRELLHEWLYHDLNHVKQVEGNAQRLLWNQLGNMQAFYAA
jgi:DinB superfamily